MKYEDPNRYPTAVVMALRHQLASAISDFSANDVPSLCSRLGLRAGNRDESFKSKYKYAERRLLEKSATEMIPIAARLLEEADSYDLSEAMAKLEESVQITATELTRRRIMGLFDKKPLSTEIEHVDFLKRVWPLDRMPSRFADRYPERNLEEDVFQATVRNDDWDNRELLTAVGLLTCSQRRFFRFLEEVTKSPAVQAEISAAINEHLRHDGYRLTLVRRLSGSPVYQVQPAALGSPADTSISETLAAFDADTVHARWTQALDRRDSDPEGAITLSRTLLEDVCKWIIVEAGETIRRRMTYPSSIGSWPRSWSSPPTTTPKQSSGKFSETASQ